MQHFTLLCLSISIFSARKGIGGAGGRKSPAAGVLRGQQPPKLFKTNFRYISGGICPSCVGNSVAFGLTGKQQTRMPKASVFVYETKRVYLVHIYAAIYQQWVK